MFVRHVLADIYGCEEESFAPEVISDAVTHAIANVGANMVGTHAMEYVPHGLTMTFFLAESHVLVSTWPEHKLIFVDVMLCNDRMDPVNVVSHLKQALGPSGDILIHSAARFVGPYPNDIDRHDHEH